MKIHSMTFVDQAFNWKLNPITFGKLTLLVGVSGVGKTQTLRAILKLRDITRGDSLNGVKWEIDFSTIDGSRYLWQGEFENSGFQDVYRSQGVIVSLPDEEEKGVSQIVNEELYLNDSLIVKRDQNDIFLNGKKTVKLARQRSVLNLLKEEDQIASAYQGFQKILSYDTDLGRGLFSLGSFIDVTAKKSKYKTLEQIRQSDENIRVKLYLASIVSPDTFNQIQGRFMDVFPFIEDWRIEPIDLNSSKSVPIIQIKEVGIYNWIEEMRISSGMARILQLIVGLYLLDDGTVILIDEFENSLGINCIDALTDDLLGSGRDLQFIITSHHPYIINKIGYEHWKLLTRKAGVVTAHDATDFNLGKSRHEAFIQLINLDQYADGVEV